jgi:ABC-type transport system involved in multi-copper enzyme maturation permease subunit
MSILVRFRPAAVRQTLAWFDRVYSRRERFALFTLFLAAVYLVWFHRDLSLILQGASWMLLLVALAFLVRRDAGQLFGPIFFYDVVRSARRSNFALIRGVYAGALLFMLFLVYYSTVRLRGHSFWHVLWSPGSVSRVRIVEFGRSFFYMFTAVQFVAVLLLTPLCAAGAVTEEKERRTLEFVLATDLGAREIILGKVAARMAYLVLFVLTGLPILSALQFLGGVDPNLVLASFLLTGLTMLSLASLSVATSVVAHKTRAAVFFTYVIMIGFLLVTSCCLPLPVSWFSAGNPFVAAFRLFDSRVAGDVTAKLPALVVEYAVVHLSAALCCCLWAAANLRRSGQKETDGVVVIVNPRPAVVQRPAPVVKPKESNWGPWDVTPEPVIRRRLPAAYPQLEPPPKPRPPVGDQPILWKELYAEPLLRLGPTGQTIGLIFGVMGLLLAGYVLLLSLAAAVSNGNLALFSNWVARYGGTGLACLMLLGIALRAAGTFTSERDRQTMDGLLTTGLNNHDILYGKWLGSILGVRKWWWVLGPLWVLALFGGGITWLSLPLLVIAWCIYAAFVAGLGMLFSLISRSTLVATITTMLTTVAVSGGHRGIWMLFLTAFYPYRTPPELEWVGEFLMDGLTPPISLGILSFRWDELAPDKVQVLTWERVRYAIYGVACYGLAATALWGLVVSRFGPITGRMPLPRDKVKKGAK